MTAKAAKADKQQPRAKTDTTISLAPLTVDEALSALLKTPPPREVAQTMRKRPAKRKPKRKGRS